MESPKRYRVCYDCADRFKEAICGHWGHSEFSCDLCGEKPDCASGSVVRADVVDLSKEVESLKEALQRAFDCCGCPVARDALKERGLDPELERERRREESYD